MTKIRLTELIAPSFYGLHRELKAELHDEVWCKGGRGSTKSTFIMRRGGRGMNFYKTAKWKSKRENVLRRDEYMCRECRRYGMTTPATTVHHIYPLEQYPEWKWATWNMLSLCDACHNKMHNRETGELSELGKQWADRTSPPSLEN